MRDQRIKPFRNRKALNYRGDECLNCKHPLDLSDVYCPYCSQLNSTKQLSIKDFIEEFIISIVSYDSRLRYTVTDLLFKPGRITRNYVDGQRLKYANPFRFFLSVSIIYFILQGLIGTFSENEKDFISTNISSEENTTLPKDSITSEASVKATQSLATDSISEEKKKTNEVAVLSELLLDSLSNNSSFFKKAKNYHTFYETHHIKNSREALHKMNQENTFFNRWLYDKNESFDRIVENPSSFVNYLLQKIPFFLFFFTPFFAFFFWLIYSKKKHTYIEHMIFIFHIFSFIFLAMLLFLIPDLLLGSELLVGILFLFLSPFYFYKALRNFYKQNRLLTLLKFVFLNVVFGISAAISVVLFLSITAAIY
ncbi:DUF3667 domain-containing protein [Ulvibacter litoralis]|uniref:DUF3667 domain-containing protein n=1 Tax=Ulvibacter litoralis TaxID=227084 RepID=A0A1G7GH20_9FLAO|nr:DUF3667 domain-containing protein [Ulvibacter litoralis]GHC56220.1 hypothetical protein GCM10008083_20870 [Ulvibacter litoralis]SDE87462.1 Protein of unknown function [Ulvibacter litoralis]